MIIPIPGDRMDERFVMHRLRSTSLASVVGGSWRAACLCTSSSRTTSPAGTCWRLQSRSRW